jgi:hypothetical protein
LFAVERNERDPEAGGYRRQRLIVHNVFGGLLPSMKEDDGAERALCGRRG